MPRRGTIFILCLMLGISGCKKRTTAEPNTASEASPTQMQSASVPFDSCALITNQEVEAIQKSTVKDTKNSGRSEGGLSFAQCFYNTEQFNRSVSLAVTVSDPNSRQQRSIKEYWEGMFAKYENEEKEEREGKAHATSDADKQKAESLREQRKGREEEHEGVPPKKIEGVGDEAVWIGTRVGGALYVLSKRAVVRVSVGGPDPDEKKIESCKALAQKAISRL